MSTKKSSLFSLDLRVDKTMVKLKVYEEDSQEDLIDRICNIVKSKDNIRDLLKDKLKSSFRKLLSTQKVSDKIKKKLEALLDCDRIVLVGIDTDKDDANLNETPFKLLQESLLYSKKQSQEKYKKQYNYLHEQAPNLNIKYQSKEVLPTNIESNKYTTKFDEKEPSISPSKREPRNYLKDYEGDSEAFARKYEAIDKKCETFIVKNIKANQPKERRSPFNYSIGETAYPSQRQSQRQQTSQPIKIEVPQQHIRHNYQEERYQVAQQNRIKEPYIRQFDRDYSATDKQNDKTFKRTARDEEPKAYDRKYSQIGLGNQPRGLDATAEPQSFQDYKITRNKSQTIIGSQNITDRTNRIYNPTINQQDLKPSKSYTRLSTNQPKVAQAEPKFQTKYDYDGQRDAGAIKRINRRYNYLSDQTPAY